MTHTQDQILDWGRAMKEADKDERGTLIHSLDCYRSEFLMDARSACANGLSLGERDIDRILAAAKLLASCEYAVDSSGRLRDEAWNVLTAALAVERDRG